MPQFDTRPAPYKPRKSASEEWKTFRKGLNLLLRPTELGPDELAVAENIMLTGSGVPTGRWGTLTYFTAGATGSLRGFGTFKSNDETVNELLALSDAGYLVKKNGSSSTVVAGQSWPSGTSIHTEQLGGKTHIVSKDVVFTSFDGTNLAIFATISAPTGLSATNYSGATGPNSVSYEIVAVGSNGGQTPPSINYVLGSLPNDLRRTQINLFWTAPSAASLTGYEVYRGTQGDETLLASVGPNVTSYVDTGNDASSVIQAPLVNTTGGVKSAFIKKYKDRLLVVDKSDPNKLMISGRFPFHTNFSWLNGGGYIYIDPDSGDNITGIEVQPIADRIVVYKERASYLIELKIITVGNFSLLDPDYTPISTSVGCSNQDTIATVENDSFYFGRDGVYVSGYEPNFLNIIRTNETSAKIRPYLALLNDTDFVTANACYIDHKYLLSFPQRKEIMVYDRERGAWLGPWKTPFGISHMRRYIDSSGTEKWVIGSYEDNQVYEFDAATNSDNGTTIIKTLRTKKTYFGDFTTLKIVTFFYVLLRNIIGTTTVNILAEDREGETSTIKTFTITGAATSGSTGWGVDAWGTFQHGISNETTAVVTSDELKRWGSLFKEAANIQIEVTSTDPNSNFELLQAVVQARPQGTGSLASSQRV
jgi:hypothetical protein